MKKFKLLVVLILSTFSITYGQEKKLNLPNVQFIKPITFNFDSKTNRLAQIKITQNHYLNFQRIVCYSGPIKKEESWQNKYLSLNELLRYLK